LIDQLVDWVISWVIAVPATAVDVATMAPVFPSLLQAGRPTRPTLELAMDMMAEKPAVR
jgi:hypothetical protein